MAFVTRYMHAQYVARRTIHPSNRNLCGILTTHKMGLRTTASADDDVGDGIRMCREAKRRKKTVLFK